MARRSLVSVLLALVCGIALVLLLPVAGLAADAPPKPHPGANNAITDVDGILVGHYQRTDKPYETGTSVAYAPDGAVAAVDSRGGWPGTINTNVLDPRNNPQLLNAVVLSGGSFYGLGAYPGVMRWLEEHGKGLQVGSQPGQVDPLVAGAIIYDLANGGDFKARPTDQFGYNAIANAKGGAVAQGVVGAGTGAMSHTFFGKIKGGLGTASVDLGNGVVVGAMIVVNTGSAINSQTCDFYVSYLEYALGNEFSNHRTPSAAECKAVQTPGSFQVPTAVPHTAIGVVATNVTLDRAQAEKMAGTAEDGLANAIQPSHSLGDGDTIYGLSTLKRSLVCDTNGCHTEATAGRKPANCEVDNLGTPAVSKCTAALQQIYTASKQALGRAVEHALLSATSINGVKSYCDTFPSACPKPGQAATRSYTGPAVAARTPAPPPPPTGGLPLLLLAAPALLAVMYGLRARRRG